MQRDPTYLYKRRFLLSIIDERFGPGGLWGNIYRVDFTVKAVGTQTMAKRLALPNSESAPIVRTSHDQREPGGSEAEGAGPYERQWMAGRPVNPCPRDHRPRPAYLVRRRTQHGRAPLSRAADCLVVHAPGGRSLRGPDLFAERVGAVTALLAGPARRAEPRLRSPGAPERQRGVRAVAPLCGHYRQQRPGHRSQRPQARGAARPAAEEPSEIGR